MVSIRAAVLLGLVISSAADVNPCAVVVKPEPPKKEGMSVAEITGAAIGGLAGAAALAGGIAAGVDASKKDEEAKKAHLAAPEISMKAHAPPMISMKQATNETKAVKKEEASSSLSGDDWLTYLLIGLAIACCIGVVAGVFMMNKKKGTKKKRSKAVAAPAPAPAAASAVEVEPLLPALMPLASSAMLPSYSMIAAPATMSYAAPVQSYAAPMTTAYAAPATYAAGAYTTAAAPMSYAAAAPAYTQGFAGTTAYAAAPMSYATAAPAYTTGYAAAPAFTGTTGFAAPTVMETFAAPTVV